MSKEGCNPITEMVFRAMKKLGPYKDGGEYAWVVEEELNQRLGDMLAQLGLRRDCIQYSVEVRVYHGTDTVGVICTPRAGRTWIEGRIPMGTMSDCGQGLSQECRLRLCQGDNKI